MSRRAHSPDPLPPATSDDRGDRQAPSVAAQRAVPSLSRAIVVTGSLSNWRAVTLRLLSYVKAYWPVALPANVTPVTSRPSYA